MNAATMCSTTLFAGALVVACLQNAPPKSDPTPPAPQQPKPASPAPAPTAKIHFEPATLDHNDLAVGETVTGHFSLVADGPVDWDAVRLATGCDCLMAEFVSTPPPTPTRAEILVTVIGEKVESLESYVVALTAERKELAKGDVAITAKRKPFVAPRELTLDPKSPDRFELTLGEAFDKTTQKPPDSLLVDLDVGKLDQKKIDLLDMGPDEHEVTTDDVIVRMKLTFFVQTEARAKPFDTEIPVEFGAPPEKRRVKVHWPATKQ